MPIKPSLLSQNNCNLNPDDYLLVIQPWVSFLTFLSLIVLPIR